LTNKSALKGGAYERKIKDLLTAHYGINFERVPHSGALKYLKGDVWAPHHMHIWQYTIECKHYKDLEFKNLLVAKSNDIHSFWAQASEEAAIMAKESGTEKYPLLIFRWNRSKDYVAWNTEFDCETQFSVKAFGNFYKIALLEDWLKENTKLLEKLKQPK